VKLTGAQALRYFEEPDPTRAGTLIFGADAMRVALKRQQLVSALIGPAGEEELRLSRMAAADVRRDPSLVSDAIKTRSFFPGSRVVLVEEAGDGLVAVLQSALSDWQPGDGILVVTAGSLNKRSKMLKAFETPRNTVAIGIYNDPPGRNEIEASLRRSSLHDIPADAMADLTSLAQALDPGDFSQTLEKLALYKIGDPGPVSPADIDACAPLTSEAEMDDVVHVIAEARAGDVAPMLARLHGQGATATGLCIAATRHFRALHAAASHPQGPDVALSRARPPVYGPRRDRMLRQTRDWGLLALERALRELMDTDLALRSSANAPAMAFLERAFIRIAMMSRH
jgi:DNA polymerase III subunit delta